MRIIEDLKKPLASTKKTTPDLFSETATFLSKPALRLVHVLLRFSNEQQAASWGGERGRLVQDARYSAEAAALCKVRPAETGGMSGFI